MKQVKKIRKKRRKRIFCEFSNKNIKYNVSQEIPFILISDPVFYGDLRIDFQPDVLQ